MKQKTIKVLLIDDEEAFAATLALRLKLRGYVAKTALSGEMGLMMAEKEQFDVAVIDLMMPGISGIETMRQLKTIAPGLPVIILTGHGSFEGGMDGMRLGAVDYLMKPIDINELSKKLMGAAGM